MLGYGPNDLSMMTEAVESVITLIDSNDDPYLYNNLDMTIKFLQGLWAEGYFD